MKLLDFYYELPAAAIAQYPSPQRDQSQLMVLDRKTGQLQHQIFKDFSTLLTGEEVIVLNNTKVFPARIFGKKETGGKVELLLIQKVNGAKNRWLGLLKSAKRVREGSRIHFENSLACQIVKWFPGNRVEVEWNTDQDLYAILDTLGEPPIPPYIRRAVDPDLDAVRYQTVYAKNTGSIAAPTAGFHFTEAILNTLTLRKIPVIEITLHVGPGTFLPIREPDFQKHRLHVERYEISKTAAEQLNQARRDHRKILAVGTTTVRTLEAVFQTHHQLLETTGETDIFIYPGFQFQVVDHLLTNFHLPESTLLLLVSAFAGREIILNAYREAITHQYRFYSYGDAMLIW